MRNVLKGLAIVAVLSSSALVHAETVVIACGPDGDEFDQCKKGAEAWARKTGHQVSFVYFPKEANTNQQLELVTKQLEKQQLDLDKEQFNQEQPNQEQPNKEQPNSDVYRIDVTWPGLLAEHFIDLKPYVSDEVLKQHFPAIVQNNTVGGKLVAMPWFTDVGLLYYRKDLLNKYRKELLNKYGHKLPTTWQELTTAARTIQDAERNAGNGSLWGFVFEAKKEEMLTCNALEWIDSFGGRTLVEEDGKVTINNSNAVEALKLAASWINDISPRDVLQFEEQDARNVFRQGNAVFMRNWGAERVHLNAKGSKVKGKVEVMALPKGGGPDGKSTGTLGGWQLAVSRYSKHPEIAADLVKYLTSPEEQKRRAIESTFSPTVMALYKDPEVRKAKPFYASLLGTFTNAVARPSGVTGRQYRQVSIEFFTAVHAVLSGSSTPEDTLKDLQKKLERMSNEGKW